MVSFSCEGCGDVLTKKKLDGHRNQCRAPFTCLDCMVTFRGTEYRSHTSCISEAQKYQGALYRPEKERKQGKSVKIDAAALTPRKAYVEDVPDDAAATAGEKHNGAVAIVDAPPRAPSPPPAASAEPVNVFDFLVTDETPNASKVSLLEPPVRQEQMQMVKDAPAIFEASRALARVMTDDSSSSRHADSWREQDDGSYERNGYTYGAGPIVSNSPTSFLTPNPRERTEEHERERDRERKDRSSKSDSRKDSQKKRKRQTVEDLNLSTMRDETMTDAPPLLHSGLTGGLSRMLTRQDTFPPSPDYSPNEPDLNDPTSPLKRSKHAPKDKSSKRESRRVESSTSGNGGVGLLALISTRKSKSKQRDESPEGEKSKHRHRHRHGGRGERDESDTETGKRRKVKAIEYRKEPADDSQQIVRYDKNKHRGAPHYSDDDMDADVDYDMSDDGSSTSERAALFLSLVTKGPDSARGVSINKVLKRYRHEERYLDHHHARDRHGGSGRREREKEEEKELWKALRLRRNDKGEVVLFF